MMSQHGSQTSKVSKGFHCSRSTTFFAGTLALAEPYDSLAMAAANAPIAMREALTFWELDTDHDFLIEHGNLIRYGNHSLTYRIVDRIFAQVPRKFSSEVEGKMGARNAELSLGNRDTIKKWRDVANDSRKELYEREKEILDLKQGLKLNLALKVANDQCILLFNEVQKAWKVSFTLQAYLKWENSMLAEKLNTEKEQNNQLRSQLAHLFQVEQEQKILIHDRDSTIKSLQVPALTLNTLVSSTGLRLAMQEPSSCSFLWVYFLLFVFGGWLALVLHNLQTLML